MRVRISWAEAKLLSDMKRFKEENANIIYGVLDGIKLAILFVNDKEKEILLKKIDTITKIEIIIETVCIVMKECGNGINDVIIKWCTDRKDLEQLFRYYSNIQNSDATILLERLLELREDIVELIEEAGAENNDSFLKIKKGIEVVIENYIHQTQTENG